jgi:predicted metal-dependent phosphoesterase TrpH
MSADTWSRADLHVHTACSDGLASPERVAARLRRCRLDVVAITDHDTLEGALRVREALRGEGPEVVIGTEVSSADGHVLALFVDRDVPAGLTATETIAAVHERGGLAIAAHPFSLALGVGDLAASAGFDAVEVVNGSPLMEVANARARRVLGPSARAVVGGSDAHVPGAIGHVHTLFPGSGAADLRAALAGGATRPGVAWAGRLAAMPAHLAWLAWLPARHQIGRLPGPLSSQRS